MSRRIQRNDAPVTNDVPRLSAVIGRTGTQKSGAKQGDPRASCAPDLVIHRADRKGESHGREDKTDSAEAKVAPVSDRRDQQSGDAEIEERETPCSGRERGAVHSHRKHDRDHRCAPKQQMRLRPVLHRDSLVEHEVVRYGRPRSLLQKRRRKRAA